VLLASARDGASYKLIEYFNPDGELRHLHWASDNQPVPWFFHNVPPDDFSLDTAIASTQSAFNTWEALETSSITFQFSGETNAEPFVFFDFINTVGFITDPDLQRAGILGATDFIVFTFTGEIAESDIFFNADVPWSVNPNGEAGHFDYESTAIHEIGHFLGLGHSGLGFMEGVRVEEGSAIMFPFAFPPGSITGRTLKVDDITGASVLYPAGDFTNDNASLSGTVTKNGQGLEAAHVTAFNPFTNEIIGAFTDAEGDYRIEGLSDGPIVVRIAPLSEPPSVYDYRYDDFLIDVDYEVTFYDGRAEVAAGASTSDIDVAVTP
jgi:hypothetical protein